MKAEVLVGAIVVYPVGAEVTVGGGIPAIINQVRIQAGNYVDYNVVWWDGRTRKAEWLEVHEIQPLTVQKLRIGFQGGELK